MASPATQAVIGDLGGGDEPASAALSAITGHLLDPAFRYPTLPAIAAEIMNLATSVDVNFRAVDRLVRRDPILAARVLSIANSPLFRVKQPVTSLRTAMMLMGWKVVREVLWQVLAESHVFRGGQRRQLTQMRRHAVGVAHLTRMLCRELSCESEFAFVCGLLHDIGRPLCLQVFALHPEISPAAESIEETSDALHTIVGERVAQVWNLPELVASTARHHHDFVGGVMSLTEPPEMARIVAAAERIADHHGIADRHKDIDLADPLFGALGLVPQRLEEFLEETAELRSQLL